jgi:hypothetical protein
MVSISVSGAAGFKHALPHKAVGTEGRQDLPGHPTQMDRLRVRVRVRV